MLLTASPPDIKRNRRRERPGARARRALNRKSVHSSDITEGIELALSETPLPTTAHFPRRSYEDDLRAREAEGVFYEYQAMLDRERVEVELEQHRFFGGDEADDDALLRLGILYDIEEAASYAPSYSTSWFVGDPNRKLEEAQRQLSLSLHLAESILSEDTDIARWMSTDIPPTTPISILPSSTAQRHQPRTLSMETPLSLPPARVQLSSPAQINGSEFPVPNTTSETSKNDFISTRSFTTPAAAEEASWTIIPSIATTPSADPEPWILLLSATSASVEVA